MHITFVCHYMLNPIPCKLILAKEFSFPDSHLQRTSFLAFHQASKRRRNTSKHCCFHQTPIFRKHQLAIHQASKRRLNTSMKEHTLLFVYNMMSTRGNYLNLSSTIDQHVHKSSETAHKSSTDHHPTFDMPSCTNLVTLGSSN